jgi:hypothetical protein
VNVKRARDIAVWIYAVIRTILEKSRLFLLKSKKREILKLTIELAPSTGLGIFSLQING